MLFDAKSNSLPKRSELPDIPGAPKGAAWFWGKDDEVNVHELSAGIEFADDMNDSLVV